MRCCVPFCKNTSDNVSEGISFHGFPSEVHLRGAWLGALGKQHSHLPDSAVVCSQHFLHDDIYESESGVRQIITGGIPSTVQVCMICLDTDSKLLLMSKHKLDEAYEMLTGHPLCDLGNLKQSVCIQCAQRLMNFSRFRDKSLRARALMMELVDKHELITRRHIKMINRTKHQLKSNLVLTTLGPDHWDLHIEYPSEDKQTELEETIIMKTEESDDSMSVDEDENNLEDFVQHQLKYESTSFHCTLCLKEFVHEDAYMRHFMSMHLQHGDGDGECKASQVCKPHTAVSCSSSHSSLITENRPADPSPSAHDATTLAPVSAILATNNENKVYTTNEADAEEKITHEGETNYGGLENQSVDNKILNCVVILHDIFKSFREVPSQGESLTKTRKAESCDSQNIASEDISYQTSHEVPLTEYFEPVTNDSSSSNAKIIVSKTCSNNVISIKKNNNSSQDILDTEERRYICDICQKMYKQKSFLVKHIETHNEVTGYTCNICQYKCKCQSHFTSHMRTHTGIKPFTCKLCDYKSTDNRNLVMHLRTHTGEKPFSCKLCDYKSTQNSNLVRHMRTHTGEKLFSCKFCDYKCIQNAHLASHMGIHTGIKRFSCKLCDYKSTENRNIVMHMRTHTGEKPFSCNLCDYKSTQNNNLVMHMRTHTGEKPFSCKLCDYKCTRNSTLVSHMRTHTGEKPFSCKLCDYKCTRNARLASHMRTHTGKNLSRVSSAIINAQ